jgi:hypothetical protein
MNQTQISNMSPIKVYDSKDSLSSIVTDVGNVYILPPICLFGIFFNLLSVITLFRSNLKNSIYQFMLINSICDLVFLSICIFTAIIRCGRFCPYGYNYYSKLYEQYVYLYVGNTILAFGALLDIAVSLQKLASFSSSSKTKKLTIFSKLNSFSIKAKSILLIILALLLNVPSYLITRNVQLIGYLKVQIDYEQNNMMKVFQLKHLYALLTNDLGRGVLAKFLLFALTVFRSFFLLLVLFIINIVIGYKFHKHIETKKRIVSKGNDKSKHKFCIVFFSSSINI